MDDGGSSRLAPVDPTGQATLGAVCPDNYYPCAGICLEVSQVCNGIPNCPDYSDEGEGIKTIALLTSLIKGPHCSACWLCVFELRLQWSLWGQPWMWHLHPIPKRASLCLPARPRARWGQEEMFLAPYWRRAMEECCDSGGSSGIGTYCRNHPGYVPIPTYPGRFLLFFRSCNWLC